MNREEAKKLLPVIQAFAEGKTIQVKSKTDGKALTENWVDVTNPDWDKARCYRIKPESESEYRPFKNIEEYWTEMQKHQPFGWIKDEDGAKRLITDIFSFSEVYASESKMNIHGMFEEFTFADGTPFGIKEDGTKTE